METTSFKTNINCMGCVAKVTAALDQAVGKDNWKVDIQNPAKILTTTNSGVKSQDIISAVEKVGFKIEALANA
ncbi:MAG: heavy-metal-associated domain-containing protein [Bacteroidetes bacterium]|nr:heavy-metal-associated domain-containing protein [Bacteroidota bacterium]